MPGLHAMQEREGLSGLRVVEVGRSPAAAMAGKVLADLGASVVKVEPPDGDPLRSWGPISGSEPPLEPAPMFFHLNAGKRSLVLDLSQPAGVSALVEASAACELLVHDFPPALMPGLGLDYARLSKRNPALVMASITPFGLSGPYRDYQASELTLIHGGGLGWLCPDATPPPERPPLRPFGHHAHLQAGLHAALTGLALVRSARISGQGDHVDLSIMAAVAGQLGRHFASATYPGVEETRLGRNVTAPATYFPCKDGVLYLIAVEQDQWNRLMEFMGSPEWSHSERFGSTLLRGEPETMAFINARVSEWTAEWEVLPLFHACQERRLGAAPLYTAAGLAQDPHLVARNFFQPHSHPRLGTVRLPGAPYRLERPWWRPGAPAPRLGDANTTPGAVPGDLFPVRRPSLPSTGPVTGAPVTPSEKAPDHSLPRPLEGVRVLDLTWVWAGPYTSQLLAFLGAQVIKVEHPRRLDLARRLNLFAQGMEPGPNRNGYFNQLGQDKLSLHLDLAHPEGLELGLRLVERCDVVLSNFGTGVMERLGLGRDVLRKRNPVLIQGLISAFGQDGPYRNYTGYGPGMIPMSGIGALTGYEIDGAPQNLRAAYADPNAGMYLALAVVASLADRDRTGQGQVIDVALWEAMLHTGFEVWLPFALGSPLPKPQENHHPLHAPHNLYRCLGADPWLAVSVMEFSQWAGLCAALKRPDLASDATLATPAGRKAREQELDALLRDWCAGQEKWVATAILQRHGVPALPSLSNRELSENPHLEAWGFLEHREHPESGRRTHTGVPWRMARRPNGVRRRAPLLGEHTSEVLRTLLEMEEGELERLRGLGVIG